MGIGQMEIFLKPFLKEICPKGTITSEKKTLKTKKKMVAFLKDAKVTTFNTISLLNAAKKKEFPSLKRGTFRDFFAHFSLISSIDSNEVLSNKYLRVLQKSHFSSNHNEMSNITFQQFFPSCFMM